MASQWYIKNFKKSQSVKLFYVGSDKRILVKWVLPENNTITHENKSYLLTPDKMFIHQGIPSVFINYKDAEPLNPLDQSHYVYSADDFNTAISSKVGQELFQASKPKGLDGLSGILGIFTLLAVGYLVYLMNDNFTNLQEQINQLIQIMNGGA